MHINSGHELNSIINTFVIDSLLLIAIDLKLGFDYYK